jgi:mannan endo-1,4-beta-mannosidase
MTITRFPLGLLPGAASLLALVSLVVAPDSAGTRARGADTESSHDRFADSFVVRRRSFLSVAGRRFRFGGANIEWLGLAGYGPFDPHGPHLPSHYEIEDAMATAREMGVRVVRSQTMGDSVGCRDCIEPTLGRFNQVAFRQIDYALKSARQHGIKVIPTIVGDDARAGGTGCVNLSWRGMSAPDCSIVNMPRFWTDRKVIHDVERHVTALLNHKNVYTHVAYKNDPTILGWDLLNGGGSPTGWTRLLVRHIRTIDRHHLILSGAVNAGIPGVDACVGFVYPHWSQPLASVRKGIAACRAARKPFIAYEYGWDRTNYRTLVDLQAFLNSLRTLPGVAGDAFWALQAHNDGHGWMPIPADVSDPDKAPHVESGQWWALYYTGISTLVTTADDMRARAQMLRRHNYAMSGRRVPRHATPPAPTITSIVDGVIGADGDTGVRVYWQGAAGARRYSVERAATVAGPWTTVCERCVTDLDDGFSDFGSGSERAWYRVVPYNLDGKPGRPSRPTTTPRRDRPRTPPRSRDSR